MSHFVADLVDVGPADRFEAIRSLTAHQRNDAKRVVDRRLVSPTTSRRTSARTHPPLGVWVL